MLSVMVPGFGRDHRALMENAHRIGGCIAWVDDVNSGSVRLDEDGDPIWHFKIHGDDDLQLRDAMKLSARLMLAAGAREVIVPDPRGTRIRDEREIQKLDALDLGPGSMLFPAPHPAGMCRMGKDPSKSVVDSTGRVHAVENLYVADPSAFPTAVSVDPSETIMAWSYVTARHMLARMSLGAIRVLHRRI
jgi:choline dehydrogenase-like flavoprotein